NRWPWTTSQWRSRSSARVSAFSTPSATTDRPKRWARSMISDAMSALAGSVSMPWTKDLSIFSSSAGILEVGQAGIAGAEIIDGDLHPEVADPRQDPEGVLRVGHQRALGDFQHELHLGLAPELHRVLDDVRQVLARDQ